MARARNDTKRTPDQVIAAIKGSGGVKTIIAEKLGVTWLTVDNYLKRKGRDWQPVRDAFRAEEENTGDMAVSLIRQNIALGLKLQRENETQVDSGDAWKWLRTRRRDEFSERQEVTGADGAPLSVIIDR